MKSSGGLGAVPVLVIGTDDLSQVLAASGHTPVPVERWQEAKAVVVGVDLDFNYERLRAAARAVAAGASFFAINLDNRFPVGPGLFDPGCGALAAAIAVAGGAEPVAIGKPQPTSVPCRHRTAWVPEPPGGHGRRQSVVRHRGRPGGRDVHRLARSGE